MATVPNWIAKAVVLWPAYGRGRAEFKPIAPGWRATNTQVVVRTSPNGPEMRFYLDTLTRVGDSKRSIFAVRLAPPDAPEVQRAQRQKIVSDAQGHVLSVIDQQRLQDSTDDPAALATKLLALKTATDEALASLAEVL